MGVAHEAFRQEEVLGAMTESNTIINDLGSCIADTPDSVVELSIRKRGDY